MSHSDRDRWKAQPKTDDIPGFGVYARVPEPEITELEVYEHHGNMTFTDPNTDITAEVIIVASEDVLELDDHR